MEMYSAHGKLFKWHFLFCFVPYHCDWHEHRLVFVNRHSSYFWMLILSLKSIKTFILPNVIKHNYRSNGFIDLLRGLKSYWIYSTNYLKRTDSSIFIGWKTFWLRSYWQMGLKINCSRKIEGKKLRRWPWFSFLFFCFLMTHVKKSCYCYRRGEKKASDGIYARLSEENHLLCLHIFFSRCNNEELWLNKVYCLSTELLLSVWIHRLIRRSVNYWQN